MNKKSKELFTESIKQAILHHVGLFESQCEPLEGYESFIYKIQYQGELCALRISHSLHRSPAQVRGEIEWISHLAANQIAVPSIKAMPNGDLLCSVADGNGGVFTAVCFTWLNGKHSWEIKDSPWTPPLFEQLGALNGKMHRQAKAFSFVSPGSERPQWYDEKELQIEDVLSDTDQFVASKYNHLNHQIRQVHQSRDDYGLIHGDFHRGSFLLTPKGPVVFDFDQCKFHLFVADIAIALFHAIPFDRTDAMQQSAAELFLKRFMIGYQQENQLDPKWFNWMPALLKQHEIKVYAALHKRFDITDLDEMDRWSQNFLFHRRERLLNDVPVVNLDWHSFAAELRNESFVAVS